jgi:hypothetical protein
MVFVTKTFGAALKPTVSATGHNVERYIGQLQPLQHCLAVYAWALDRYAGPLYLEVVPLSFTVRVRQGLALSTMRARVRSVVRDESKSFVSDTDIDGWLNEAQTDLAVRTETIRRKATGDLPVPLEIALPSVLVRLLSARFGTTDVVFVDDDVFVSHADAGSDPGHKLGRVVQGVIELSSVERELPVGDREVPVGHRLRLVLQEVLRAVQPPLGDGARSLGDVFPAEGERHERRAGPIVPVEVLRVGTLPHRDRLTGQADPPRRFRKGLEVLGAQGAVGVGVLQEPMCLRPGPALIRLAPRLEGIDGHGVAHAS